jgi:hypothetical protein
MPYDPSAFDRQESERPPPAELTDERKLWTAIALLGIGALVIGCFLPVWDVNSVTFFKVQGNSVIQQHLGWINLALAGVAAISLIRAYSRKSPTAGPLILGVPALLYAIYVGTASSQRTLCPASATSTSDPLCQVAKPGSGVYVIGAGGGAMLLAGLFLVRKKTYHVISRQENRDPMYRECPHCKEQMRRDAGTCPHCREKSSPWIRDAGLWWQEDGENKWYWRNDDESEWHLYDPEGDETTPPSRPDGRIA